MKNKMMITEEELMNVSGGISRQMKEALIAQRDRIARMYAEGKISEMTYRELMLDIAEQLNTPGCAA